MQVLFKSQGKSINEQKKAVELEDIKFHQCVRLTRFETDRTISFIPPDGAFDLMVRSFPAAKQTGSVYVASEAPVRAPDAL